jgi:glycosyltransferase involved in cell wall biosynthesis
MDPASLRVAILSGSWPPERCGVADYAAKLSARLQQLDVTVAELGKGVRFASPRAMFIASDVPRWGADVLHIQYPTLGFGRSIVPALIPLLVSPIPCIVTLHEFSTYHPLRMPWFFTFAQNTSARIFSSEHELEAFRSRMKPRSGLDYVLPIPSNIPSAAGVVRQPRTVCYFGLLVPNKGIEDFLALAAIAAPSQRFTFSLIGGQRPGFANYAQGVIDRTRALGITLHLDLPERGVAQALASQTYAYLPFPDGASPRRGSLRAAQVNGVVVLTKWSDLTSALDRASTFEAGSPADALTLLNYLEENPARRQAALAAAERAGGTQVWDYVADQHKKIYQEVLASYRQAKRGRSRTECWSLV